MPARLLGVWLCLRPFFSVAYSYLTINQVKCRQSLHAITSSPVYTLSAVTPSADIKDSQV